MHAVRGSQGTFTPSTLVICVGTDETRDKKIVI